MFTTLFCINSYEDFIVEMVFNLKLQHIFEVFFCGEKKFSVDEGIKVIIELVGISQTSICYSW